MDFHVFYFFKIKEVIRGNRSNDLLIRLKVAPQQFRTFDAAQSKGARKLFQAAKGFCIPGIIEKYQCVRLNDGGFLCESKLDSHKNPPPNDVLKKQQNVLYYAFRGKVENMIPNK